MTGRRCAATAFGCPALVVSPYVDRGVSNVVFDHTSIMKTILLRFCTRSDSAVRSMGARAAAANHLGSLLIRPADRPRGRASDQQLAALIEKVAAWRRATYRSTTLGEVAPAEAAAAPPALTDLQEEVVAMSKRLRAAGLQPSRKDPEVIGHQRCCARGYRRASARQSTIACENCRSSPATCRDGRVLGQSLAEPPTSRESQASQTAGGRTPGTPSEAA